MSPVTVREVGVSYVRGTLVTVREVGVSYVRGTPVTVQVEPGLAIVPVFLLCEVPLYPLFLICEVPLHHVRGSSVMQVELGLVPIQDPMRSNWRPARTLQ